MVNTIRKNFVHIAFTDSEKDEIKKHAKDINMTISEFCRQAIFEKIQKIKNPELFYEPNPHHNKNNLTEILDMLDIIFYQFCLDGENVWQYEQYKKLWNTPAWDVAKVVHFLLLPENGKQLSDFAFHHESYNKYKLASLGKLVLKENHKQGAFKIPIKKYMDGENK